MKKGLKIIAILLTTVAIAQQDSLAFFNSGKVKLGLLVNLNFASLQGSDMNLFFAEATQEPNLGFGMGVFLEQSLGRSWLMNHDLSFQQSNLTFKFNELRSDFLFLKISRWQSVLQPFNIGYRFGPLSVSAGPYAAALLDANTTTTTILEEKKESVFGDAKDEGEDQKYFQKFDFGLNANLAITFKFGLVLNLRYQHGFIPVFDNANAYTFDQEKNRINIYNRNLQFGAGWWF